MIGRFHGITNGEGAITPITSPWGQRLKASRPILVRNPPPLVAYHPAEFRGSLGTVFARVPHVRPIVALSGYGGDMPLSQQPRIQAPPPWERK